MARLINKLLQIFLLLLLLVTGLAYFYNYWLFQRPLNQAIKETQWNQGLKARAHLDYYFNPSVLKYDLVHVRPNKSRFDLFRLFLRFAQKMNSREFQRIKLAYKGKTKFQLSGDYFRELGQEGDDHTLIYLLCTFPQKLTKPDGSPAYNQPEGDWPQARSQLLRNYQDFENKWYLDDLRAGR